MRKFTDANGHEWTIRLTVGVVEDVRRQTDTNIAFDDWGWADLMVENPSKFVSVLWVLIEKQATGKGVGPEEFGYGFDGQTLEAAGRALGEAIVDFFPFAEGRNQMHEKLARMFDPSTDSHSPTNVPESVESIPENLACAN